MPLQRKAILCTAALKRSISRQQIPHYRPFSHLHSQRSPADPSRPSSTTPPTFAANPATRRSSSTSTEAQLHTGTSPVTSTPGVASAWAPIIPDLTGGIPQSATTIPTTGTKISPSSFPSSAAGLGGIASAFKTDPTSIVGNELASLTKNIKSLLGSGHPFLDRVAKYYINSEGKHIRPMVVLLMSRATAIAPKVDGWNVDQAVLDTNAVNTSLTPLGILNDFNPDHMKLSETKTFTNLGELVLSTQRRLAEIVEMIHAASLLHDDVIDLAETRRGKKSGNLEFGNKMAVLAGDFLLGRASVALARLRDAEVTELMSTVIANLVEGEFMQLENSNQDKLSPEVARETLDYYLQKTYLKSAALISKSCRSAAVLGGATQEVADAAYQYGKNLGLAFQLVDDMLDYTVSAEELGKPAGADLNLGLATAPALFAWEEHPELGPMIERKFSEEGDVVKARSLVVESNGLARTKALAESYCQAAIDALACLPDSEAKEGLIAVVEKALKRKK
ncbi:terpenoid synthase [Ascobolus immersus RN42]|uniref:Terpenoid synthase n=1 Tax=Ascobolus immersus RN42 TaxID=1160509 RepID=A0A3N4HJA9_ASCIM|nr:terpenoid synthase [Ascobolus immersus RN42]